MAGTGPAACYSVTSGQVSATTEPICVTRTALHPAYRRQRRNRKDELNNTHPNRPSQFFEAQLAGGTVEEIN
jgi:hypothetical protein